MRIHILACVVIMGCSTPDVQAQVTIEPAFPNIQFTRPVDLQAPADGTNRIFVVEQRGVIKVLDNDDESPVETVFLDIQDRVDDSSNEEGLLGLAFHPEYSRNSVFFVYYTAPGQGSDAVSVVVRYFGDAGDINRADPESGQVLLTVDQPAGNHNGGQIAFGPDGYLYIALGDGGGADDQFSNGQDRTSLLGSILRIDVNIVTTDPANPPYYLVPSDNPFFGNNQGYREEIYAYGLRNPWRFSFDSQTGTLFAADVGQNAYEEVNVITNGGNYGWNTMEGFHCFHPRQGCDQTGLVLPIVEYPHDGRSKSVTGGYVYRGSDVPELVGKYIYADYLDGRIWGLTYEGAEVMDNAELARTDYNISSFGVDEQGELYMCAFNGQIYRFVSVNTGVEELEVPAPMVRILPSHPNPFRDTTTIRYVLDAVFPVDLVVYTSQGRRVRSLVSEQKGVGEHIVQWDGRGDEGFPMAAGVYFARLEVAGRVVGSQRIVLVR